MANRLGADAEQKTDAVPHDLIGDQEENRGDDDHHEHHHGGDGRLLARRPGDLLRLGPHFLQELEWVELCHVQQLVPGSLNKYPRPPFRRRPTEVLFGECSPRKSVTGPLAMAASYCRAAKWSSEEVLKPGRSGGSATPLRTKGIS